jgi:hypothetical protein
MRPRIYVIIAAAPLFLALNAPALLASDARQGFGRSARAASEPRITIYIGPQTREGFVDVDSGILDSINDIQNELRGSRQFNVVRTADEATIVLSVVGRRTPGASGFVGAPIGTTMMMLPIERRAIDTILRVGTYEKTLTSEADNGNKWTASAKKVVKDVTAWVNANRSALAK